MPRVITHPGHRRMWNTDQGVFRALDAVTSRSCDEDDTSPNRASTPGPHISANPHERARIFSVRR